MRSVGVDISSKVTSALPGDYAEYIYSEKFESDVIKRLGKIYDGVFGMFASSDVQSTVDEVLSAVSMQSAEYEKIKNAGLRVRRCILGEIKEKPDGGLYYTKQFRYMFNCVLDVIEFLTLVRSDERMRGYAFFYQQLLSFYKSIRFLRRYSNKICLAAMEDISSLKATVEKEIADLKRYKMKVGSEEVFTYSVGIEKRQKLLEEADEAYSRVEKIRDAFSVVYDFADVLRGENYFVQIGKCENTRDVLRFFNREILKKTKTKLSADPGVLYKCDPFALCLILVKLGYNLSPKYAFLFVDEGQDISPAEYGVLRAVNDRAIFNIFGDLKQNITEYRGVSSWSRLNLPVYNLSLNYRNTNQIVEYVAELLGIDMTSIGLNGAGIERIDKRSVTAWLSGKNGLKALICSEKNFEKFSRKSYNLPAVTGKISKTKINLMTVYQSKGLEFTAVAVADGDLSLNEKYVAYTRALKELAIIK